MILVTGGAGFIGHGIIAKLNSLGHSDLVVTDHLSTSIKWKNLAGKNIYRYLPRENLFDWLDQDPDQVKITAIVHMGACSHTSEQDMDYLIEQNLNYSIRLYRKACQLQIPFLYASSAATYGNGEQGYDDCHNKQHLLKPINRYGLSKQWFDSFVLAQTERPPFYAGFKFFNVFGPGEYHKGEMRSLVCKAVPQIQQSGRLKLFRSHKPGVADGEQLRDFVYLKDVVEVVTDTLLKAISNKHALKSGLYNVGCGKARSFFDLGKAVFDALGKPVEIDWIDIPENIRSGYQYFTEANLTRLRTQLGYTGTFTSLEEAVSEYVCEYLLPDQRSL